MEAVELATATLGDVAEAIGRARRTVELYRSGERRVTADAMHRLADYLRQRARVFTDTAEDLERAVEEDQDA